MRAVRHQSEHRLQAAGPVRGERSQRAGRLQPGAIRTDNGVPFATTGIHGLSQLNVWWMRLGIQHQRILPAHPRQNGAHERIHKTLKGEAIRPPRANLVAQQRTVHQYHQFRRLYNKEKQKVLPMLPVAHSRVALAASNCGSSPTPQSGALPRLRSLSLQRPEPQCVEGRLESAIGDRPETEFSPAFTLLDGIIGCCRKAVSVS